MLRHNPYYIGKVVNMASDNVSVARKYGVKG